MRCCLFHNVMRFFFYHSSTNFLLKKTSNIQLFSYHCPFFMSGEDPEALEDLANFCQLKIKTWLCIVSVFFSEVLLPKQVCTNSSLVTFPSEFLKKINMILILNLILNLLLLLKTPVWRWKNWGLKEVVIFFSFIFS